MSFFIATLKVTQKKTLDFAKSIILLKAQHQFLQWLSNQHEVLELTIVNVFFEVQNFLGFNSVVVARKS